MVLACCTLAVPAWSQNGQRSPQKERPAAEFRTTVPEHPYDLILTRPTDKSITISVLTYKDVQGYIAYGTSRGVYASETQKQTFKSGEPVSVVLSSLKPNTRYYYQFKSRESESADFTCSPEYTFITQRPMDSSFTFTVTADSHLDEHTGPDIYRQTLVSALGDAPDFHIDLGDTFMTEKHPNRESAAKQYLAQRYYFGLIGNSASIFLTLGNHDGETAREMDGTKASLAMWSINMRKRFFPNPQPDSFYTGNSTKHEVAGMLEDYYSWQWGNALFVVLDPFWYTPRMRGGDDNWMRTLGTDQYQWLKRTLESSKAKYKFVFIHHLVGGMGKDARGGVEAAGLYEWGGKNPDGSDVFKDKRPGWPAPIHKLLVDNHVSVVFHGHDHFYAKQTLDGIIYQEVPQPGFDGRDRPDVGVEYGYKSGEMLGGTGYIRVKVTPDSANVEYVRSSSKSSDQVSTKSPTAACSYSVSSHSK